MRLNMRFATATTGSSIFSFELFTLTVIEAWGVEVDDGADENFAEVFLLGLVLLIGTAFPSNKVT